MAEKPTLDELVELGIAAMLGHSDENGWDLKRDDLDSDIRIVLEAAEVPALLERVEALERDLRTTRAAYSSLLYAHHLLEDRVAQLEEALNSLQQDATSAILNALAWMPPDIAHRYREDSSYRALAAALSKAQEPTP